MTFEVNGKRDARYRLFEMACHEGNYSMTHMLSAARAQENRRRSRDDDGEMIFLPMKARDLSRRCVRSEGASRTVGRARTGAALKAIEDLGQIGGGHDAG